MPASSVSGPVDTVDALYSDHHGWLVGWLRRKLGCPHHAADLAHDTFVRILAGGFGKTGLVREPRGFLATIANRVVVDHIRRRTLERAYLQALAILPEPLAISPEEHAMVLQALCRIDTMLDGLGSRAKRAFLMSQLDGMTYAEIADVLGVSVSSVKKYVARATEHCLLFALDTEPVTGDVP